MKDPYTLQNIPILSSPRSSEYWAFMLRAFILTQVYGAAKVKTLLAWVKARCFKLLKVFNRAVMLLLVKCYDWVIYRQSPIFSLVTKSIF